MASIVGGHDALPLNRYPWMAHLYFKPNAYCGGMLIASRVVLTAGERMAAGHLGLLLLLAAAGLSAVAAGQADRQQDGAASGENDWLQSRGCWRLPVLLLYGSMPIASRVAQNCT